MDINVTTISYTNNNNYYYYYEGYYNILYSYKQYRGRGSYRNKLVYVCVMTTIFKSIFRVNTTKIRLVGLDDLTPLAQ